MKNLLRLAVLIPLVAFAAPIDAGTPTPVFGKTWLSAVVINPLGSQVLVDTGAIEGPTAISFCAYASADIGTVLRVQLRDAANTTTVSEQLLTVQTLGTSSFCMDTQVSNGQRIRIINNAAVIGTVSASFLY